MADESFMTSMNFRINRELRSGFQRVAKVNDRNTSQFLPKCALTLNKEKRQM